MTLPQQNNSNQPDAEDIHSEGFGTVPKSSEAFGNIRNGSESFRTVPKSAEQFGTVRNTSERTEHHTVTVREAARFFEEASVTRTERSIINWCQPNRQGVARLDAFFDTNERRYYITGESIKRAIEEERSRQSAVGGHPVSEPQARTKDEAVPNHAERADEDDSLRAKLRDLEITNRVKDQFITMLEGDRKRLTDERETYVRELMAQSRQIGELETRLLQLGTPMGETVRDPIENNLLSA